MSRLVTAAFALTATAALVQAAARPRIGSGSKACALGPKANGSGVKARWIVDFHGNLKGINLRGADFSEANLSGATMSNGNCTDAVFELADLQYRHQPRHHQPEPGQLHAGHPHQRHPQWVGDDRGTWSQTTCPSGNVTSTGC